MEIIKNTPRNAFTGVAPLPEGAKFIANVRDDRHPLGAALIHFEKTGIYSYYLAGTVCSCDQMEARKLAEEK